MNMERLKRLREVVAGVDPKTFYIGRWYLQDGCGTVGCAAGHYIMAVKPDDLRLTRLNGLMVPTCENNDRFYRHGYRAMASHFDISSQESFYLFDPTEYELEGDARPEHVLEHIDALLNAGAK